MLEAINVVSLVGAIMIAGAAYAAGQAWYAFVSRGWPSVRGRLLLAGVYEMQGIPPVYRAHARYRYEVDGVALEGSRLRFGATNPFSPELVASDLPSTGGEVEVFYDPRAPRRACLITGPNETTLALPILLLIFGAGTIGVGLHPL